MLRLLIGVSLALLFSHAYSATAPVVDPAGNYSYVCSSPANLSGLFRVRSSSCVDLATAIVTRANEGLSMLAVDGIARYRNSSGCALGALTLDGNNFTVQLFGSKSDGTADVNISATCFSIGVPPDDTDLRSYHINEILVLCAGLLAFGIGYLVGK